MSVNIAEAVDPSNYTNGYKNVENKGGEELGKDAFLKILVTQLKNQDPLKPMEDKEFISQMAQFSSLEQMNNMNQNFNKLMDVQKVNQNSALIGKTIEKELVGEETTQIISGEVTKISFEDGETFAHIENEDYPTVNVKDITAIY